MKNSLPLTTNPFQVPYMEKRYFCKHQTAFQSFRLHLTMAGYKLPVPTANAQSVNWLHLETPFHWPQTPSTHGKMVFLWPPDSFDEKSVKKSPLSSVVTKAVYSETEAEAPAFEAKALGSGLVLVLQCNAIAHTVLHVSQTSNITHIT